MVMYMKKYVNNRKGMVGGSVKMKRKVFSSEIQGYSDYQLVDYFDVWGNPEDGFEVNNLARLDIITISDDSTDREIFDYLKNSVGYFNPNVKFRDVEIWNDGDMIEFSNAETGEPLCRLERVWR